MNVKMDMFFNIFKILASCNFCATFDQKEQDIHRRSKTGGRGGTPKGVAWGVQKGYVNLSLTIFRPYFWFCAGSATRGQGVNPLCPLLRRYLSINH